MRCVLRKYVSLCKPVNMQPVFQICRPITILLFPFIFTLTRLVHSIPVSHSWHTIKQLSSTTCLQYVACAIYFRFVALLSLRICTNPTKDTLTPSSWSFQTTSFSRQAIRICCMKLYIPINSRALLCDNTKCLSALIEVDETRNFPLPLPVLLMLAKHSRSSG